MLADRIARAALLLFVAGRCLVPMDETDLFFNLRLGEIVLQTGQIPTTNLLSFTHPDAPDPNLAWLFQILLALVHRAGGIAGTVLLKTAFVVATWNLLFSVAIRRGAHPAVAAAVLALAAWAAEPRFVERPHLVTFLGLALLLRLHEARRPGWLWALVPLGPIWANANSCFFWAPVLLLLHAAGARWDGRRQEARRSALVAGALVPFIFATPATTDVLRYLSNHWRMPDLRPLQEYRGAEWPLDGPFLLLMAAVLLVAASRTAGARHLLPVGVLALVGALRIRFVAEFAILSGPLVAAGLTTLLGPRLRATHARITTATVAAALALLMIGPRIANEPPFVALDIEPDLVPTEAIAFVERHALHDRLYNDMEVGSYLTWRWGPRRRVFQDPRINGYPEAFHAVLRRNDLSRADWQQFVDGFGVTAALITYPTLNPRAAWWDPEQWALVYRAADGLVLVKRSAARQSFIATAELPLTFRYARSKGVEVVPLPSPPQTSPVPACVWALRLGQYAATTANHAAARGAFSQSLEPSACLPAADERSARRSLATAALHLGDFAQALGALAPLDDAQAHADRGFAHLGLRDAGAALAAFDLAAAHDATLTTVPLGRGMALEALGRRQDARAAYEAFVRVTPEHLGAPEARRRLHLLAAPLPSGSADTRTMPP